MAIKVLTVMGTRPEAVKLAPVVKTLDTDHRFLSRVCFTSQHDYLLQQIARAFGVKPDHNLRLMTDNQTLHQLTSKVLLSTRMVIEQEKPDVVIVQGDTTTAFATGLSAFYLGVPIAHVEARPVEPAGHDPFLSDRTEPGQSTARGGMRKPDNSHRQYRNRRS
jgi:UDP-N-acetylglucosamine 2-epimerase (non-hydrolysing)